MKGYELSPEATDDLPGNLGLHSQRQPGRSGQARRGHLCSMRAAREKSPSWPPTFGLDGRTCPVLAGAGAIHGDLPARYGAAEDRPYSSGRPQRLGSTLSVPKRYFQLSVGAAITMFMQGTQKERPLTHDLLANILRALGAKIDRLIVNDLKGGT